MTKKQSPTNNTIVLTIAGSDSGGGAGVAADLKTFAALGVHGTCAITSVTAQNTTGVLDTFDLPPAAVTSQIEAVCMDMDIKWVKTGMLASPAIIREVAREVKKHKLSLVLDPVMAAEAGGNLLRRRVSSCPHRGAAALLQSYNSQYFGSRCTCRVFLSKALRMRKLQPRK